MRVREQTTLLLNGHSYQIERSLGAGAVSEVYLASLPGAPQRVVVRLVRAGCGPESPQAAAMRAEAETLILLNAAENPNWPPPSNGPLARHTHALQSVQTRRVIALIASGNDPDGLPFVVQELAPPPFRPLPAQKLSDEAIVLHVAEGLAAVIALCHAHQLALNDFEPWGEKGDRVCVAWEGRTLTNLKIIDWNGTLRDAEPAALERDLLLFGGHLYEWLLGEPGLPAHGQPPAQLGFGVPHWQRLSVGTRLLLERMLNSDPQQRYHTAQELCDAIIWWRTMLRTTKPEALRTQLWQAEKQPERVLALADRALRLDLNPPDREFFKAQMLQAQRALQAAGMLALDPGLVALKSKRYERAAEEFQRARTNRALGAEQMQQARIYQALAQLGSALQHSPGDERHDILWGLLEQAAGLLVRQQWKPALELLEQAAHEALDLVVLPPFVALLAIARAGLVVDQDIVEQSLLVPRFAADGELGNWLKAETMWVRQREQSLAALRTIAEGSAPDELRLREYYATEQSRFERQRTRLGRYRNAFALHYEAGQLLASLNGEARQEDYRTAADLLEQARHEIRNLSPGRVEAPMVERLQAEIEQQAEQVRQLEHTAAGQLEQRTRAQTLLQQAERLLRQNAYQAVLERASEAERLLPGLSEAIVLRSLAQAGIELTRRAAQLQQQLGATLEQRDLALFRQYADQLLGLHGTSLALQAGIEPVPAQFENVQFALRNVAEARKLLRLGETIATLHSQITAALRPDTGAYTQALARFQELEETLKAAGYTVTDTERAWQTSATTQHELLEAAQQHILQAADLRFDTATRLQHLHTAGEQIAAQHTRAAEELRDRIALDWVGLIESAPDLERANELANQASEFLERPVVRERIRVVRGLLRRTQALGVRLQPNGAWPAWFGAPGWGKALNNCIATLNECSKQRSLLRALPPAIAHWYDQIEIMVAAYLEHEEQQALEKVRRADINGAYTGLQHAWEALPEPVRARSGMEGTIEPLLDALRQRAELDSRLQRLIEQLVRREINFTAAATLLKQEPATTQHPDLGLDEIARFSSGIERAATIANLLEAPAPSELEYIERLLAQQPAILQAQEDVAALYYAAPLSQRMRRLHAELDQAIVTLTYRLCRTLDTMVRTPDLALTNLVEPFWKVRWCRAALAAAYPTVAARAEQSLTGARMILEQQIEQVAAQFCSVAQAVELEQALVAIHELVLVSSRFFQQPAELHLPAGVELKPDPHALKQVALGAWEELVETLIQLTPASHLVDRALGLSQEIVERLRTDVWEVLFEAHWANDSFPARLERRVAIMQNLLEALRRIEEDRQPLPSIESIQELCESIAHEQFWLLDEYSQALEERWGLLRREREAELLALEHALAPTEPMPVPEPPAVSRWNGLAVRRMLMAGGVVVLLAVVFGGFLLNNQNSGVQIAVQATADADKASSIATRIAIEEQSTQAVRDLQATISALQGSKAPEQLITPGGNPDVWPQPIRIVGESTLFDGSGGETELGTVSANTYYFACAVQGDYIQITGQECSRPLGWIRLQSIMPAAVTPTP